MNLFHLKRQYEPSCVTGVLQRAHEMLPKRSQFSVLDLGSADGEILQTAWRLFPQGLRALYGVEGGSRVGACEPGQWILAASKRLQHAGVPVQGLDREWLFSELHLHPVAQAEVPIIAHMYDGGVMRGKSIEEAIEQLSRVARQGSVAVFVTARPDAVCIHDEFVAGQFIKRAMRARGWTWKRSSTLPVCESGGSCTMEALFFRACKQRPQPTAVGRPVALVALGMHTGSKSDMCRLRSVQCMYAREGRAASVYAVSKGNTMPALDGVEHVSADFKSMKAFGTSGTIRRLVQSLATTSDVVVVLDYFWLQNTCYDEIYGDKWPRKARQMLDAGASVVYLPLDEGSAHSGSKLDAMFAHDQLVDGIQADRVPNAENPLFRATVDVEDALVRLGKSHDVHIARYIGTKFGKHFLRLLHARIQDVQQHPLAEVRDIVAVKPEIEPL